MAVSLTVKVVPASGMQKCMLDKSGVLKCFVKSPPEDGAANKELIKFLAKQLGLPQAHITIIRGATSRTKSIKIITDLSQEQLYARLGVEVQNAVF